MVTQPLAVMPGRPWTPAELNLLRTRYGALGPRALERILGRSYDSVLQQAHRERLMVGHIKGWLIATEIDRDVGLRIGTTAKAAKSQGVEVRIANAGSKRGLRLVPEAWALEYREKAREGRENDMLVGFYYDTNKVARILGYHPATVRRWCSGHQSRMGRLFRRRVKILQSGGATQRRYLCNPHDVEDFYMEQRRAS